MSNQQVQISAALYLGAKMLHFRSPSLWAGIFVAALSLACIQLLIASKSAKSVTNDRTVHDQGVSIFPLPTIKKLDSTSGGIRLGVLSVFDGKAGADDVSGLISTGKSSKRKAKK